MKFNMTLMVLLAAILSGCGKDSITIDFIKDNNGKSIIVSDKSQNRHGYTVIDCPRISSSSTITERSIAVINDADAFNDSYLASDLAFNSTTVPVIDFEQQSVVAIHQGEQPSSGYQVSVNRIELKENIMLISYEVTSPSDECPVDTVLTYPYCFIGIKKTDRKVMFNETTTKDCFN